MELILTIRKFLRPLYIRVDDTLNSPADNLAMRKSEMAWVNYCTVL